MFQNDTIVYPKESPWFATYNVGNKQLTNMKDTIVYKNDTIGLRTLVEANKVYMREVPNADHCQFGDQWILT